MDTASAQVVLLSGGIDSAALAAGIRPRHTLFIDYGQLPATAERQSAAAVARQLNIPHSELRVDLRNVGAGVLSGSPAADDSPSPEWWPYRNQLLVTCGAAWAIKNRERIGAKGRAIELVTGSVGPDGDRHRDGTAVFYDALRSLLMSQEGNIAVAAPGLDFDTPGLVRWSQIEDSTLGWTHSCHQANLPCGECPGCHKRDQVLEALGRLQYGKH